MNRSPISLTVFIAIVISATFTQAQQSASSQIVAREDVVYGRFHGTHLLADIAYSKSKKPLPAIISVHGGRCHGGNKKDGSTFVVSQWAGFESFAMSIDYRLVGASPAPSSYHDVQCAIRYVHTHGQDVNVDPDGIFLRGQSAGRHMMSLAATLGDRPFKHTAAWKNASNAFRGVNNELTTLSWGDSWTPPTADADHARRLVFSVNHVTANMKPLLILHSDNDRSVPINNAMMTVDALQKADPPHSFHRYTHKGHMGITDKVIQRAREFIEVLSL